MTLVPAVSETALWMAELNFLAMTDARSKSAQFAIRTAERACCLAIAARTDPVDELLDARCRVTTPLARGLLERAITYVRADQSLSRDLDLGAWGR